MLQIQENRGMTVPPQMPQELPNLTGLLTKNVPSYYKPAVASAVFPALAAHLHGVKFRYWDNVLHEATFMNVLVGRQSVGKGCIKKPIDFGRQLEDELNEEAAMQRHRGPQNLLNLLPDSFTREQYRTMRFSCGKQGDGESTLRVWMNRKYIVFNEENRNFCKTEDYMKKVRLAS